MTPRVTVLQLDTSFPRIAGDVGCPDSYARPPQIIKISGASVGSIVTDTPQNIDVTPFAEAMYHAEGDIIVTSCGFLSYWQDHLAKLSDRPFISSSLVALEQLAAVIPPDALQILTFDANRLNAAHFGRYPTYVHSILGLLPTHHLRQVISQNLDTLDDAAARKDVTDLMAQQQTQEHQHILLECTNLPPYRAAIKAATGLPVTDILTMVEAACPGAVDPRFN